LAYLSRFSQARIFNRSVPEGSGAGSAAGFGKFELQHCTIDLSIATVQMPKFSSDLPC
jgi:hypothetical protein